MASFRDQNGNRKLIEFEEGWEVMKKAIEKLKNILEGLPEPQFTGDEYMILYTNIFFMCTQKPPHDYSEQLYEKYKETFEEYIKSTVLPSLREKNDELLLRELLRRWSNHKIMTRFLSRVFRYLDRYYIKRRGLSSLQEASFLSFYYLVYDEMNRQVMDAILAMFDRKRAGEHIDETLVNNALAFYSEIAESTTKDDPKHFAETMIKENATFYHDEASNRIASSAMVNNTQKEEKMCGSPLISSKKINLISSDGVVFEVDYNVALMSKTIEDAIEINPAGDINSISLPLVNSEMLTKIIEYCKVHNSPQISDADLVDWDVKFVDVDHTTLFDIILCANYMNIIKLLDLASQTVADMIKGKTPDEIRKFFDIKSVTTKEEDSQ